MQAYEEILSELEQEHYAAGAEDPYYAYYVKHLIERVQAKYEPLSRETE